MNKTLAYIVLLFFIVQLAAADDIAYIVKDVRYPDIHVVDTLESMGHTVHLIDDADAQLTAYGNYDLIFVGDQRFAHPEWIPVNDFNSVVMNSYHVEDWGFADSISSIASNVILQLVYKPNNTLVDRSGYFSAYTSCCQSNGISLPVYYLSRYEKASGIKTAVSTPILPVNYFDSVVGLIANGTQLKSIHTSRSRTCYFGITESAYWTSESLDLFKACVNYSLYGLDKDSDGAFSQIDCNDSDPSIYPGAAELDDGIDQNCVDDAPIFSQIDNVTAEEDTLDMTLNLSDYATDVDDTVLTFEYTVNTSGLNITIQDNMMHITALKDFHSSVLVTVTAQDPSMQEASVSFAVTLTSVNDAPVFADEDFNQSVFEESELYFTVSCIDADEDSITYADNTTLFDINPVTGEVHYLGLNQDIGNHIVSFTCSDGNMTSTLIIDFTVFPINHPPVQVTQFHDMTTKEDTAFHIDLSDYFSDIDAGNTLTYNYTSDGNIEVTFEGSIATITPLTDFNGDSVLHFSATDGTNTTQANNFTITVTPVNDAPVLGQLEPLQVVMGQTLIYSVDATDVDGDTITLQINNSAIIVDGLNLSYTATQAYLGNHVLNITISDGQYVLSASTNLTVVPKILINEMAIDPRQDWSGGGIITNNDQWFELFNPGDIPVDLTGWTMDFIDFTEETLVLDNTIGPGERLIILNQPGVQTVDYGRLILRTASGTLVDSVTYGNWNDGYLSDNAVRYTGATSTNLSDECLSRRPDGFDSDNDSNDFVKQHCTFDQSNDADIFSPVVTLVSPSDQTTSGSDVIFTFNATDDAIVNCALYTDLNGSMSLEQQINYSSDSLVQDSFIITGLADNQVFTWNILCTDKWGNVGYPTSPYTVTVQINDPPKISLTQQQTQEDTSLDINLSEYVFDEEGDILTYTVKSSQNATCSLDGSVLSVMPINDFSGTASCDMSVSDGEFTAFFTVDLLITPINDAPELTSTNSYYSLNEDSPFTVQLSCTDIDSSALDWSDNSTLFEISDSIISFTPLQADVGTHVVEISCSDNEYTSRLNITFDIINVNDAPLASIPLFNATEDTSFTINLSQYVTDEDGDNITYTVISGQDAACTINIDLLTFTPAVDHTGPANCAVRADDGTDRASFMVEAQLAGRNDPPRFNQSVTDFFLDEDIPFTTQFSCIDIDSSTLDWSDNSTLFEISDSIISFTPLQADVGTHVVEISCSDSEYTSKLNITFNIASVNDAPVVSIPVFNGTEDTPFSINLSQYVTDEEGDNITYNVTGGHHATCTVVGDSLTLTPFVDFAGIASCDITASDIATETVFLLQADITGVNDAPVFNKSVTEYTVYEDTPFNAVLTCTDVDGDQLSFSDNSTWFDVSGGWMTFTPNNDDVGVHVIHLVCSDGQYTDNYDVRFTIVNVNDAPVITDPGIQRLTEYVPYSLDIQASDIDNINLHYADNTTLFDITQDGRIAFTPDTYDVGSHIVRISVSDNNTTTTQDIIFVISKVNDAPEFVSGLSNESVLQDELFEQVITCDDADVHDTIYYSVNTTLFSIDNYGRITYTPTNADVGTHAIEVYCSDREATTAGSFVLTIVDVNDAPVIRPIASQVTREDIEYAYQAEAYDIDADEELVFTDNTTLFDITSEGLVTFIPEEDDVGIHNVQLTVTDHGGLTDSITVQFTVLQVNDPPVIQPVTEQHLTQDIPYSLRLNISDEEGDAITCTDNTTLFDVTSGCLINFTPSNEDVGQHQVRIIIDDGTSRQKLDILFIIDDVNDAPEYLGMPTIHMYEDMPLKVNLSNYFTDPDSDSLTYSILQMNLLNGSIVQDQLTLTPKADTFGTEYLVVTASDGELSTSSDAVEVVIEPVNDAPELNVPAQISVIEGELVSIDVVVTDIEGDPVTLSFDSPMNQQGTWQTSFSDAGIYMVNVTASDNHGGVTIKPVMITVNEYGNHAPQLEPLDNITVTEGEEVSIMPFATDLDGDALTFMFSTPLDESGYWHTTYTDAGIYDTTVSVTDGNGGFDVQHISITVEESGNHQPNFEVLGSTSVEEGDDIVLEVVASDPDNDALIISVNSSKFTRKDNTFTWHTTRSDIGLTTVEFSVSDGTEIVSLSVRIIVDEKSEGSIFINSLHMETCVEAGDLLQISGLIENDGTKKLRNVHITAQIPELAMITRTVSFDLPTNDEKRYSLFFEIPQDISGIYTVRVVYSNDDAHRVKVRPLYINNRALGVRVC